MSNKDVILKAVNSMSLGQEFTRNDLFRLVGGKVELIGKTTDSKALLYNRKF